MESTSKQRELELEAEIRAAAMEHQKAVHAFELKAEKHASALAASEKETVLLQSTVRASREEVERLAEMKNLVPELQAARKVAQEKASSLETRVAGMEAEKATHHKAMEECVSAQRRNETALQMAQGELQRARLELEALRAESRSVDAQSSQIRHDAESHRAQAAAVESRLMESVREREVMHSQTNTYRAEVSELRQQIARSNELLATAVGGKIQNPEAAAE